MIVNPFAPAVVPRNRAERRAQRKTVIRAARAQRRSRVRIERALSQYPKETL